MYVCYRMILNEQTFFFFHWSSCDEVNQSCCSLFSAAVWYSILLSLWDWICITALCVNTTLLEVSNSQSSRRVHWSACAFLCSGCCWALRGNVVRMKAAGSLSITLKSSIWSSVLLHWRCFDTFDTYLLQVCFSVGAGWSFKQIWRWLCPPLKPSNVAFPV